MKDETTRTIRTAVQTLLAVAAAVPVVLPSLGVTITAGYGATVVAIAASVTRLHQVPVVNAWLARYLKIPQ